MLYIVIGAYGSGKSEYSINIARTLKEEGRDVVLADMDVVNPYFRSRDVREEYAKLGIEVVAPEGQFMHADLPMLSPRIQGAIDDHSKTVILDVGGDPAGCRTLGRFTDSIRAREHQMHFVVNTRRPFTGNMPDIIVMKDQLEFSSKQKITHIVCNTNLMQYTDAQVVEEGIEILKEVQQHTQLPFEHYLVLDEYANIVPDGLGGKKRMVLRYNLKKPWERLQAKGIC